MSDITLTIIWHNNMPIAFWFGEKLVWESDDIITDIDFPETKITLPLLSAVKFSSVFLQGLIADRLLVLLATLQMKIDEVKALKAKPNWGQGLKAETECTETECTECMDKQVDDVVDVLKSKEPGPAKKDDFYCDKECNHTCSEWNKCDKMPPDEDDTDWDDAEDENETN